MVKENFFKKALKGIFDPSTNGSFPSLNGSAFYQVGAFFGYDYGASELKKYLNAYGRNPLVYMIIHRIATTTAGIKRKVYNTNSGEEMISSVLGSIMESPNNEQGEQEFYEECFEYFLATGNVFIRIVLGLGMGAELRCLNSARMKLELNSIGEPLRWIYTDNKNKEIPYELDEILHIKTSNVVQVAESSVYFGLSPLEAGWMVVKSSDEILSAEASIFKNRGIIGILTNETDTPMLTPERERLQKQFQDEVGGSDRFNTIKISNTKLKYIQTGMSPTDLKLLEGIMNKLRLLCSIYGMSSVLFNDTTNSTYNNVIEAEKASYNNVFIPLANKLDREISIWLSEKLNVLETIKIDLTTIEVIKASTNEVAQALNNMSPLLANNVIANLTINEIRELAGLPARADGNVLPVLSASPSVSVST